MSEYACRGLPFTSQKAAELAAYWARSINPRRTQLRVYICTEGHWHYGEVR